MKTDKKTEAALIELRKKSILRKFAKGQKVSPEDLSFAEMVAPTSRRADEIQTEWSLRQLSLVTGIDRHEIKKRLLGLDAVPGKRGDPVYKAPECFRALIRGSVKPRGGAAERKAIAEANRAERRDQVEAGEFARISDMDEEWIERTILLKQHLDLIGHNLESQGKIDRATRVLMDCSIRESLLELHKKITEEYL
jgi:hypothetical protein